MIKENEITSDEDYDAFEKEIKKKYGKTKEEQLIGFMKEYLEKHEANRKKGIMDEIYGSKKDN